MSGHGEQRVLASTPGRGVLRRPPETRAPRDEAAARHRARVRAEGLATVRVGNGTCAPADPAGDDFLCGLTGREVRVEALAGLAPHRRPRAPAPTICHYAL